MIRPKSDQYHDYRGYAGQVAGGVLKPGDEVMVLPSGMTSTIEAIDMFDRELDEAFSPMSVVVRLADDVDVSTRLSKSVMKVCGITWRYTVFV